MAPHVDVGFRHYVRGALQGLGWATRRSEEGGWSLRAGEDAPWSAADLPAWLAGELRAEEDRVAEQRRAWEELREGDGAGVAAENDWSDVL